MIRTECHHRKNRSYSQVVQPVAELAVVPVLAEAGSHLAVVGLAGQVAAGNHLAEQAVVVGNHPVAEVQLVVLAEQAVAVGNHLAAAELAG